MPTQDSYDPLSVADDNTFATGFRKDPVTGALKTYKIPVPFLRGSKWTIGVGVPVTPGEGDGDQYLNVSNGDTYTWDQPTLSWGQPNGTLINGSYQFPIWISGKPFPSEVLYSFESSSPFVFQQGMQDSIASSKTAATAMTVFSMQKNGVEFGTVTFAAGSTVGSIACPALASFFQADIFELIAPSSADSSLADIRFTLVANRPSGAALSDIVSSGEAAASAAAAAASATAAASSATGAGSSAGAAASSATAAAASATTSDSRASAAISAAASAAANSSDAGSSAAASAASATAAGASAANALTSEGNASASAAIATAAAAAFGNMPNRNRAINGDFRIALYATNAYAATGTAVVFGPGERMRTGNGGAGGTVTSSRSNFPSMGDGVARLAHRITATAIMTDSSVGKYWSGLTHIVEGYNCYDLIGRPIAVSFLFNTNLSGTYPVAIRDSNGGYSYLTTFTASANTPKLVTVLCPAIPTAASLPTTTAAALSVSVGAVNTGTYQGTPNTGLWQNSNYISATGATNWALTAGNFIEWTELNIEEGTVAHAFVPEDIETVYARCRRYHQLSGIEEIFSGNVSVGSTYYSVGKFATPMRAAPPTVVLSQQGGNSCFAVAAPTLTGAQPGGIVVQAVATVTGAGVYGWAYECVAEL